MKRYILLLAFMLILPAHLHSQYYFGRNKVQYDNFKWKILRTDHFDIYYYPEMRKLAEIGAAYAEDAYKRLVNQFDQDVSRRIPLIFYSNHLHFQETNTIPNLIPPGVGGFFEFLKGRVVIPANGSLSDFKHVINHELVHVFMHSKVNRVLKDHRRVNNGGPPLWFTEGLAEYWSEGWDTEAEMFIRDATLSGYIVPVSQMYRIFGTFLMYKEGQAVCKFIAERFGEEKILQLMENVWMADDFSTVMRYTLGVDYRQFDEMWLYDLKKKKYPILENSDMPGMVSQKITVKGINTKPAFCRFDDEDRLIFVSNRIGYSNIYQMRYTPGNPRPEVKVVVKGERTSNFESFNLLRSKIDANNAGELVFVAKSKGKDAIYKVDLRTRKVQNRLQFDEIVTLFSPCWSPDGDRIVFTGVDFGGQSDLYIYNFKTQTLEKLTNDFYDDRDPSWSPKGEYIAFSSDRTATGNSGAHNLFIYSLATGDIRYLTYGNHNDLTPAWSPDGRSIAFVSDRDDAYNIWMMRVPESPPQFVSRAAGAEFPTDQAAYPSALDNQTEFRKVTHFVTGAFDPEWTDDNALIFTAFEKFSFQLRRLANVGDLFRDAEPQKPDSMLGITKKWPLPSLDGKTRATTMTYKLKFNLDIAQSQITQDPIYGTSGGAQFAFSDMLGNHQYYFLIYNTGTNRSDFIKSFNVAITKLNLAHRAKTAYGLYHYAGNYYTRSDGYYYERRYGGFVAVSYPLSVFQRVEVSFNLRQSNKDWYGLRRLDALLVSNFVSWVRDNSLWGATGPIDGERFNFAVGHTLDVRKSNVNFYTLQGDYRRYYRIAPQVTYAVRLWGAFNLGKEAIPYFMGGSWDFRLYPQWSIWGRKLFLVSQELRVPFIDQFVVAFPFGGLGFRSIKGALFADFGNAWDDKLRTILGSYGFSFRLNIGGFLVLRYDMGQRFQVNGINSRFRNASFDVSSRWYREFFFGWDF